MNGDVIPRALGIRLVDSSTTAMGGLAAAAVQQLQAREEETVSAGYIAEDNSGQLVGISIAFAVITTILVGLRFYAKRFQAGGIFADEVFLVLAWVVNLGMCALGVGESRT